MNRGPLVCTIFVLFLYILKIPLLLFLRLDVLYQQEFNPKVVDSFQFFALALKFRIFVPNFKISFIVFLSLVFHCVSNRCSLSYSMLRCAPIGYFWRPYNYGIVDPDTKFFIQCYNGRDPMIQELWCHRLASICCEVHPTARLEIATGDVGEFTTNYLTCDRRCNSIIV